METLFHFHFQRLYLPQNKYKCPMNIKIVKSLLPQARSLHRYMSHDGKLDYLGQILVQMGYNVDGKYRTPQDLGKAVPPFTQICRGTNINSILTIEILKLDHTPPNFHPEILERLLRPHNFHLTWEA